MAWILANIEQIVAIAGGVVMLARLVVKITPTPKDDTALEKVVGVLKHLGLHVADKTKPPKK